MKKIILLLFIFGNISSVNEIKISAETLKQYKTSIDPFLDKKRNELAKLNQLPSGDSFIGSITNFFIESVVSPLLGYGEIDIEQAKKFLSRSFQDEEKLTKAIQEIENDPDNIRFISTIFQCVSADTIHNQTKPEFFKAVRQVRHSKVPNPKQMADKDKHDNYMIKDDDFYKLAASTFMTFHVFETNAKSVEKKRKSSKKGKVV